MLLLWMAPEAPPGKETLERLQGVPAPLPPIPPYTASCPLPECADETFPRSRLRGVLTVARAAPRHERLCPLGGWRQPQRHAAEWVLHATAAGGALRVFRGFQRDGTNATLRRLNLGNLVGRAAGDLFISLTDVICPNGGPIDEGMARDAWLETVADLDDLGIDDATALTAGQMQELFLAFVAHSIEARLFQDIGVNGLKIAADLAAIQAFETEFRSYIRRSVRDSFSGDFNGLATLSDRQIMTIVDRTYEEAWDLLMIWGDAEE